MINQFTNDKGVKYLFVGVPEVTVCPAIDSDNPNELTVWYDDIHYHEVILPEGSYEVIGLSKDLTEEQWKEIIDECDEFVSYNVEQFEDYYGTSVYDTSIESSKSLLKSLGFKETDNIAVLEAKE